MVNLLKIFSSRKFQHGMDLMEKTLQEIGLSEKEARMYLAALKFPHQPISILAKKTTMNRGTAFVILHELLKKGLVKKTISADVLRFSAAAPDELMIFLENKEFELSRRKEKIEKMLPVLKNMQGIESKKPIFQFYEGREGMQNLFSEMLRGEHNEIKSILSAEFLLASVGGDFLDEFALRRVKRGCRMISLLAYNDYKHAAFLTDKKMLRQTRYMPEPLSFPMTIFLFGKTAILFSHKENYALSIQSSEYTEMQEVFFDTIWAISRDKVSDEDFRMPIV